MTERCKDCVAEGITTVRPIVKAKRCATHHRAIQKIRRESAHDKRVQRVYGLPPGGYQALYEAQGGHCAILGCRATGTGKKKLAVDHDHRTGEPRGLLCGPHNQLIGYNGDSPAVFRSIADYLENPPARQWLTDGVD